MGADRLPQTPWQTVGPFFHYALPWTDSGILTTPETIGARIIITGRVFDADGAVVPDAMVEIWQANAAGRYRHPDDTRADRAVDPAFIGLLGRGLLKRLATRLYFPDVADNDEDPILALVPHERRHTLIATQIDAHSYGFDIIIQGEGETVFFDV
jgi:protocatechuate 3,4-dioxygenase alpha subunit